MAKIAKGFAPGKPIADSEQTAVTPDKKPEVNVTAAISKAKAGAPIADSAQTNKEFAGGAKAPAKVSVKPGSNPVYPQRSIGNFK